MRTFKVFLNNSRMVTSTVDGTHEIEADRYTLDVDGALIFYRNSPVAVSDIVVCCYSKDSWYSFWEVTDELQSS